MCNQKTYIEEYMLKRKGTNTLHRKLKIEQHEPHKNRGELMWTLENDVYQSDHHRLLLNICMGFMFYLQYLYSSTKLMSNAISISDYVFVLCQQYDGCNL
jgi:hypothetical protein